MKPKNDYLKIPCPNCANKIIGMVSNVESGKEVYKCQICKTLITYDHSLKNVEKVDRYVRKTKKVFKRDNPSK